VRHVCAWCKREYGASDDAPGSDFVTHGICEKCEAFFEANQPKSLRQFLDGFDIPILCVDANVQVLTANDAACRLLAKDHDDIGDFLCGDVVQCRWARLPEGCGGTEHCVGCAIRLMVRRPWSPARTYLIALPTSTENWKEGASKGSTWSFPPSGTASWFFFASTRWSRRHLPPLGPRSEPRISA
jgi:hypothetical protein